MGASNALGQNVLFSDAWGGETCPCRSGNCAPTSLTLRGVQMDLGPPVLLLPCEQHGQLHQPRPAHPSRRALPVDRRDDQQHPVQRRAVLLAARGPELAVAADRHGAVRDLPAASLPRAVQRDPSGVSGRAGPLARCLGRLHGRLRDQQRVSARRRQHRAAVPHPDLDRARELPDGRGRALDGRDLRLADRVWS